MARIAPTFTELYRGVQGDRKVVVIEATIAGTYAAASAAADGVYLAASALGLNEITHAEVTPLFTADSVEEQAVLLGQATGSGENGIVLALTDKADDLQSGNGSVSGVKAQITVYGRG